MFARQTNKTNIPNTSCKKQIKEWLKIGSKEMEETIEPVHEKRQFIFGFGRIISLQNKTKKKNLHSAV